MYLEHIVYSYNNLEVSPPSWVALPGFTPQFQLEKP